MSALMPAATATKPIWAMYVTDLSRGRNNSQYLGFVSSTADMMISRCRRDDDGRTKASAASRNGSSSGTCSARVSNDEA